MAMEKDCDLVSTLKGSEFIRALTEDGATVRIPVSELGKVMSQIMPLATYNTNGLARYSTNPELYYIPAYGEIEIPFIEYGIYSITSNDLGGESCIFNASYYEYSSKVLVGNTDSFFNIRLKKDGVKIIIIKSLKSNGNNILFNRI